MLASNRGLVEVWLVVEPTHLKNMRKSNWIISPQVRILFIYWPCIFVGPALAFCGPFQCLEAPTWDPWKVGPKMQIVLFGKIGKASNFGVKYIKVVAFQDVLVTWISWLVYTSCDHLSMKYYLVSWPNHTSYLLNPPRQSNFSSQVCFWWPRGTNVTTLGGFRYL